MEILIYTESAPFLSSFEFRLELHVQRGGGRRDRKGGAKMGGAVKRRL